MPGKKSAFVLAALLALLLFASCQAGKKPIRSIEGNTFLSTAQPAVSIRVSPVLSYLGRFDADSNSSLWKALSCGEAAPEHMTLHLFGKPLEKPFFLISELRMRKKSPILGRDIFAAYPFVLESGTEKRDGFFLQHAVIIKAQEEDGTDLIRAPDVGKLFSSPVLMKMTAVTEPGEVDNVLVLLYTEDFPAELLAESCRRVGGIIESPAPAREETTEAAPGKKDGRESSGDLAYFPECLHSAAVMEHVSRFNQRADEAFDISRPSITKHKEQ